MSATTTPPHPPLSSRKARALAASQAGQQVRVEARSGQPCGFPKTWARSGQPCGFPKNVGIFSLTQRTFLFFSVSIVLIFCVFTACAVLIVFYCLFCSYGFSLFLLLLFLRFPRRSCRSRVGSASRSCTLKKKQAFCGGAARAHGETATAPRRGAEFGGERAAKITFQNGAFCIITSQLSLPLFPIILTAAITIYYSLLAIG